MHLISPPAILGELETAVMERFWASGEASVKDVNREVGESRGVTLNTIQSTVKRLYEKGLLKRRKVSHAYLYRPRLTRAQFQAHVLSEVVELISDGASDGVLSAFVEVTESAGPERLRRLEALVAQRLEGLDGEQGEP
ncbi:MAG: penicillinase repressor [Myxococcales bacterium]|nr:penicillinase repressor [Myxococcales bacterium]